MSAILEEKFTKCKSCGRNTKHYRNASKSSGFMILIHLILIVCTAGIWLPIIVIWKMLFAKVGGWKCGGDC